MTELWTILGIPPTAEIPAIRRAYAEKLRTIDQDRDADAFMSLRTAFTTALRIAGQPAFIAAPPPLPPPRHLPTPPEQAQDDAKIAAEMENFRAAEAAGDLFAAYAPYNHLLALGAGGGPGAISPLSIRLATIAAAAPAIATTDVDRLLANIGLDAMALERAKNLPGMAALIELLNARTAAETWLEAIQKRAAAGRWSRANFRDRDGYHAALFITGRRYLLFAAYAPAVQRELARFDRHRRFIAGRLDASRLDAARARRPWLPLNLKPKHVRWIVFALFVGAAILNAILNPAP